MTAPVLFNLAVVGDCGEQRPAAEIVCQVSAGHIRLRKGRDTSCPLTLERPMAWLRHGRSLALLLYGDEARSRVSAGQFRSAPPALAVEECALPRIPGATMTIVALAEFGVDFVKASLAFEDGALVDASCHVITAGRAVTLRPTSERSLLVRLPIHMLLRLLTGRASVPECLAADARFDGSVELLSLASGLIMGPEWLSIWALRRAHVDFVDGLLAVDNSFIDLGVFQAVI